MILENLNLIFSADTFASELDWLQSLNQFFINEEPLELDWLRVYDMTH